MAGTPCQQFWNVEGDRDLSEAWTGFAQFTILNGKPPDGFTWCGRREEGRLTKTQTNDIEARSFVARNMVKDVKIRGHQHVCPLNCHAQLRFEVEKGFHVNSS